MPGEIHNDMLVGNLIDLFKTMGYDHPVYYFEMFMQSKSVLKSKDYCDIAFYYPHIKRHLMGIEIKNWVKSVSLSILKKEFFSYRDTFDLFYLVAKKFSNATIKSNGEETKAGIIQMNKNYRLNLLREATILNPDNSYKEDFLRRLKANTKIKWFRMEKPLW